MQIKEVDVEKTEIFSIGRQYSHNVLVIHFVNLPNLKNKYIYYKIDDIEEEIPLVSDLFIVSRPLTMHSGKVKAQIIVRDEANETIGLTKNFTMIIKASNYSGIGEDENYPDDLNIKNYFVKIDEKVNSFEELANLVQTKLDNGEFIGAQGPKGDPGDVTEEYRNLAMQIAQNASDAQTSATNAQTSASNAQRILDDTGEFANQTKSEMNQIKTDTSALKEEANTSATNAQVSATAARKSLNDTKEFANQTKTELNQIKTDTSTLKEEANTSAINAQKALDDTKEFANQTKTELNQIKTDTSALKDEANASAVNAKASETKAEEYANNLQNSAETISQLKEDLVANEKEDAKTKRSLSALWDLNKGISYRFETDSEKAYKKQIPSGAKLASVNKVGGKTIAWNQMIDPSRRDVDKIKFDESTKHFKYDNWNAINTIYICKNINVIKGHKYYIFATDKIRYAILYLYGEGVKESLSKDTDKETYVKKIITATGTGLVNLYLNRYNVTSENVSYFDGSINLFDLTKIFGSGNEPSTPEEFEAMLPNDYYAYNEGELMSMSVNNVIYTDTSSNQTSHPIPQSIQNLDGYGWSAGTAYNYVDFENKKYYKCVDKRAYQSNDDTDSNVITDGTNTYYELAEPIVTDISNVIGDTFQEPFEVESGGSFTFKNTNGDGYQIAVPSDIQYTVALSEVNA